MNTLGYFSAAAFAHGFATDAQAARLAALGERPVEPRPAPTSLWDDGLLDRLTQPLSRLRE